MCEIGYCSLVTFRMEACYCERVNSNTEIGFTSRFKEILTMPIFCATIKRAQKVTLLITGEQ